ncbi:MAG: class II aldolase/adducin family protein, partial [Chloroflexota bacterium]|nr:class II aldolase/adducin family protein [Chloroflexota bacterium]
VANDGNISVRLNNGCILITPSGLSKGRMAPEDLLVIDGEGRVVKPAGDPALRPTSECPMHLEVYRQRPDVRAVLHAHPPYATALTVAGKELRSDVLPEVIILLGEIPTTAFALPSSPENATAIRELIINHDALLIRQHGSLTVGRHLDEALINLERLEHVARVQWLAESLGHVTPLPAEMLPRLWEMYRRRQDDKTSEV